MYWGTIHRMIFFELLKVFILAWLGLTGIILLAGVINEAMRNGFGPVQILACIPLLLPSLLPYTVPTTTLFATCIVYGRLSADNEILALKSAGVHILHVIWPAVFLGAITSAITMFCFLDLIPYTGFVLRNQMINDIEEVLYTMLRKDNCIRHHRINWEIDVKTVQGRKLQEVIFKRKTPEGRGFDTIAWAKEAELRVDLAHKQILVHMRHCHIKQKDGSVAFVESRTWPVDITGDWGGSLTKVRAMDMTWDELTEYQRKAHDEKQKVSYDIDLMKAGHSLKHSHPNDGEYLKSLEFERKHRETMIFSIHAERAMRPSLAFGCLCFALVGCPVGIWFSKSDYLSAFITCFLPIVIVYYPMLFCMNDLGRNGKLPAWLVIPAADVLVLLSGFVLLHRLSRN
ncbi:MAG: LptF/LptG family permease [Planctomycetes bacterium]|nr:LptF/LptG family permease [Planctomycetota bacterium]